MRLARVKSEEEEDSKLHIVSEEEEDDDDDDDDDEESSEDDSDSEEVEVENDTRNGTDTANTSITRPDEDTAPAPAPAPAPATGKEKETAATTADPLDPVCMFGPHSTIPENVRGILDEWHKKNPKTVPPCSYRSGIPKQAWKVFDRNGNEVPFALFMIKRPIPYKITFISNEDGSGKLVACRPYSPFQIFLIGWNGLVGYDEEACAVRLFGRNLEDIVFTPGCFDKAPGPKPEAATTGAAANGTSTEKNTTRSHKRGGRRGGRKSGGSTTRPTQRRKPEDETISGSAPENASSNESSQSEREDIPARPTKRSRNSTSDAVLPPPPAPPAPPTPPKTTSPNTKEVAFKLVSELSDATRCFPITECKSSRDLFAKARKFFRLLDEKLEVNVLSCRIPSKHERRYLFEGSQGEFNLLIHDVRNLQGVSAKTLIIEVKCME